MEIQKKIKENEQKPQQTVLLSFHRFRLLHIIISVCPSVALLKGNIMPEIAHCFCLVQNKTRSYLTSCVLISFAALKRTYFNCLLFLVLVFGGYKKKSKTEMDASVQEKQSKHTRG